MATVRFSRPAESDLRHLPQIAAAALETECAPRLADSPRTGKPLHGPLRGLFSYDFHSKGVSYRIAYEIVSGEVIIIMVGARDNFYKKLLRRIH